MLSINHTFQESPIHFAHLHVNKAAFILNCLVLFTIWSIILNNYPSIFMFLKFLRKQFCAISFLIRIICRDSFKEVLFELPSLHSEIQKGVMRVQMQYNVSAIIAFRNFISFVNSIIVTSFDTLTHAGCRYNWRVWYKKIHLIWAFVSLIFKMDASSIMSYNAWHMYLFYVL